MIKHIPKLYISPCGRVTKKNFGVPKNFNSGFTSEKIEFLTFEFFTGGTSASCARNVAWCPRMQYPLKFMVLIWANNYNS